MSAPDTDLEREKLRHRPALFGIGLAAATAALLMTGLLVYVIDRGQAPEGAEVQIDGRTGAVVDGS